MKPGTSRDRIIYGIDPARGEDATVIMRGRVSPGGVVTITQMQRFTAADATCRRCRGVIAHLAMFAPLRECCRAAQAVPCPVCACTCRASKARAQRTTR